MQPGDRMILAPEDEGGVEVVVTLTSEPWTIGGRHEQVAVAGFMGGVPVGRLRAVPPSSADDPPGPMPAPVVVEPEPAPAAKGKAKRRR